jgi:beta-N-acetylhexosaminidase
MAAGVDVPIVCNGQPDLYHEMLDALEAAAADGRLTAARVAEAQTRLSDLLRAYPSAALDLDASVLAADAATEAEAARRAVTVLGAPAPLRPGAAVALFGRGSEATSGASDAARPVAALVDALEEAGVPVRWATSAADLPLALAGAQALIVATSERRPLDATAVAGYRAAFDLARAAGVPAVHAALWNPAHVNVVPGPAIVPFGFRTASATALAAVLLGAEATGRAPVPLVPWGGA